MHSYVTKVETVAYKYLPTYTIFDVILVLVFLIIILQCVVPCAVRTC